MVKLHNERRKPKNVAEGAAFDAFLARGVYAMKRGWPDFVGFVGNTMIAVEVKPDKEPLLKPTQAKVMQYLARHGVPVYLFTPARGFEPMFGSTELDALLAANQRKA